MLRAVNIGRSQPRTFFLSRRRSMRRLLLANFRCMIVFTRNPSLLQVVKRLLLFTYLENNEGFRVFQNFSRRKAAQFACLGTRLSYTEFAGRLKFDVRDKNGKSI